MSWLLHHTYWRFRHWRWNRQETATVDYIIKAMAHQDVVYVHTFNGGPPIFKIERVKVDWGPHGHIESHRRKAI